MIVVDTNTIAYLYLPTEFTSSVEELLEKGPQWAAPTLWRSELRNILTLYLRQDMIDFETAINIQSQAELILVDNEYDVDSVSVLTLANQSNCSAYDCEFISLAKAIDTKLVTHDKKLIKAFPDIAITAKAFASQLPR